MRSFPGKAWALGVLLIAGCRGEGLPDDPRPVASGEAVVPAAALSARLEPSSEAPPPRPAPLPGGGGAGSVTLRDDAPVLSNTGLPVEVVRRITRQNFGRLRVCYRSLSDPSHTTTDSITVRYTIDVDGEVGMAIPESSTFGEPKVGACVAAVYRALSFPMPASGPIVVTHTLYFTPPSP